MATATSITNCVIVTCRKGKVAYKCEGCSQYFCIIHLPDHHQAFGKELDKTEEKINLFRETLIKQTTDPQKHSLIQQINQWENDSMNKIRQTAEEARQVLLEHIGEHMNEIEIELTKLTKELTQIREENDFNEIDLNKFEPELKKLEEQLNNPSNISIQQDSSAFINKISVIIHANIISIDEVKPSAEQIDGAKKLQLPSTFYLYENKEPCKGCPGYEEDTPTLSSNENKTTTKEQTDTVKNDAKMSGKQQTSTSKAKKTSVESPSSTSSATSQYDNKPSIFGNFNVNSGTSIFESSTPLNNGSGSIFVGDASLKPSANTNGGFSFSAFGSTTATIRPSTGFQFSTPPSTSTSTTTTMPNTSSIFSFGATAAASANKPFFGNAPKFSCPELFKQTSSNDKPTSNGTEQRVFAGPGSLILGTTTTAAGSDNTDDSYEPNFPFKPIVQLSAVEVKTGEEDENILFCERAKLYRFDAETNQIKERGVGEMKILQHKTTNRCRILMRREQVLKLCANHQITSQMELKPHQGSENAYVWSAMDFAEGEAKHETLCIRFKSSDIAKRFVTQFNNAKKANANS